jgi:hypothetical protein
MRGRRHEREIDNEVCDAARRTVLHEPENLTLSCDGHHRALHDGKLTITGKAPDLEVRWAHDPRASASQDRGALVAAPSAARTTTSADRDAMAGTQAMTHDYVVAVVSSADLARPASPVLDRVVSPGVAARRDGDGLSQSTIRAQPKVHTRRRISGVRGQRRIRGGMVTTDQVGGPNVGRRDRCRWTAVTWDGFVEG